MARLRLLTVSATLTSLGKEPLDLAKYGTDYSGLPLLDPADLVQRVPEVSRFADVEPDRDWGNLNPRPHPTTLWLEVATHLQQLFDQDPGLDGAVVVHGTNMLEETAYFLNLVLKTDKTVVVVGAQRPFSALSSDGPLNLINAVRVAASPDSHGKGVLVLLNDQIHSARTVSKTSTYRLETFQSPGLGPIGFTDTDRVVYYFTPDRPHTMRTPFDIRQLTDLPRVEILYGYHGADGGLVEAAVALGAKGIVVAGSGAGSMTGMVDALKAAIAQGVVVVRSSRVGSGRVIADDNYTFTDAVASDNLPAQKARVLLQLCLTQTQQPEAIQGFFDKF